ncbi:MAG TPA: ABC transporter ATP-binding protein [Dongiaceae bacterium]|jgi:lipoprotein-releasing system ATP-binding protein
MSKVALELKGVQQRFRQAGNGWLEVIRRADLRLESGEMVALVGPSGSGKSTLLHISGLLEQQADGEVVINGSPTRDLNDDGRTALRRTTMGFVYQYHHLLPEFSALENVVIPQMIAGKSRSEARERAASLLRRVGLGERLDHRPAKLSGGEQQRVAIARALANNPAIVLADEPTGNLDVHTADQVFEMLAQLVREDKVAAMIATHNLEIARRMDRAVTIREGILEAA